MSRAGCLTCTFFILGVEGETRDAREHSNSMIYYPELNLEELYDHRTDPEEWDNVAYRKENEEIKEEHRSVLLEMLPELTWNEEVPEWYNIDESGLIRKADYVPLENVQYK